MLARFERAIDHLHGTRGQSRSARGCPLWAFCFGWGWGKSLQTLIWIDGCSRSLDFAGNQIVILLTTFCRPDNNIFYNSQLVDANVKRCVAILRSWIWISRRVCWVPTRTRLRCSARGLEGGSGTTHPLASRQQPSSGSRALLLNYYCADASCTVNDVEVQWAEKKMLLLSHGCSK